MSASHSANPSSPSTGHSTERPGRNYATIALVVGIAGLAVAAIGIALGFSGDYVDSRPLMSWLLGFSVWFSVAIGMMLLIMIWYLFDAGWPIVLRRQLEHALAAFPWLALIFLPLLLLSLFGGDARGALWKWMDPSVVYPGGSEVGSDPLYLHKEGYLNPWFFAIRTLIYAAVFIGVSAVLRQCSFRMDTDPRPEHVQRARRWSAFGVIAVAMALTFAAFDFYMSLSYHWFSTMYGVWFFSASMRAGIAMTVILFVILAARGQFKGLYSTAHAYDLGCLSLAFTIFWAYISFCQYFLIYNANIPEETFWYNMRELTTEGALSSWFYVSVIGLVLCYFLVPFFYLLSHRNKVTGNRLLYICVWIVLFHILDIYFNIMPKKVAADNILGYDTTGFGVTLWDIAAIVGVGGICIWAYLRSASKTELIPIHDPRIGESVNHHL